MSKSTVAELGTLASVKRKGVVSSIHWEGLFFLVIALLLGFQERFLATDASVVSSNYHFLNLYFKFTSALLSSHKFLAIPFLVFFLYSTFRSTSSGLPRRICDFLGIYYFLRMTTLLIGLNLLIFDVTSSRFLLITQLLFFLPYCLLIWGWVYWRLDTSAGSTHRRLFRLDIEREDPRPIDYLISSFSSVFSASISGIKGRSARARILILVHGIVIYDIMGLTLSRAVALVQAK